MTGNCMNPITLFSFTPTSVHKFTLKVSAGVLGFRKGPQKVSILEPVGWKSFAGSEIEKVRVEKPNSTQGTKCGA